MTTQKKKKVIKRTVQPKAPAVQKFIDGWKHLHTVLIIISMVIGMTVGALTFFVSAEDFNKFQKDVNIYQLEDQATKAGDRIIELNREINSPRISPREKAKRLVEKQRLEMRLDIINKRLSPLYNIQQQKGR